jgi:conjugative transfer signal peptidase TraF
VELVTQDFSLKRAKTRRPQSQRVSNAKSRCLAIVLLTVLLFVYVAIASGLRINGTHSLPVGFYCVSHKDPQKGDLVTVDPPGLPLFTLAKNRGYLNVAYSPAPHLLKRLVGMAGDKVTIDSAGVEVNGIHLANSAPRNCDGAGRPLQPYLLRDYILGPGEILLMSDYSPESFDARYFGPVQATAIESVIKPLLTWN